MAYDVSATPLRWIFPQYLAMIVQFYGAGKAAAAIIAAAAANTDRLARSETVFGNCRHRRVGGWGGDVARVWCQPGTGILHCLCDVCKISVAVMER
jgi:hypothetical protein